jgi:hypothetical protein
VVLEAYTDPNVPPLPPHITLAQACAFAGLLYGEPRARQRHHGNIARDALHADAGQAIGRRPVRWKRVSVRIRTGEWAGIGEEPREALPAGQHLKLEPAILAGLANAMLHPNPNVDWQGENHRAISGHASCSMIVMAVLRLDARSARQEDPGYGLRMHKMNGCAEVSGRPRPSDTTVAGASPAMTV